MFVSFFLEFKNDKNDRKSWKMLYTVRDQSRKIIWLVSPWKNGTNKKLYTPQIF